jgi:hypothetical protein
MKFATFAIVCCLQSAVLAQVFVPEKSTWKYFKGTVAPSSPATAWRAPGFNDAAWLNGAAPIYYGENLGAGTVLNDMRNGYTTFFTRKSFNVPNAAEVARLKMRIFIDDGYIVWINGQEVARYNVSAGEQSYQSVAVGSQTEPVWTTNSFSNPSTLLVNGANVIAVHVLNRSITSTDIVFDLELDATVDTVPPTLTQVSPPPGKVNDLTSVTLTFSEPVQGVAAPDFLVNNVPAQSVTGTGTTYTFTFQRPDNGPVDITLDDGHQIADFADPPHPFDASNFSLRYDLVDETAPYLASIIPPPFTTVRQLNSLEVRFSEAITNLNAADLLVNGVSATNVETRAGNIYIFQFPAAGAGTANITWSAQQQITDLATNNYLAESWSYVVDPNLPVGQVVISEFLTAAEKTTGLLDEDGDLEDWIELHNTGTTTVNLAGWSLTDDPDEPGLWTFPNVTLVAGARLVVFASGKDRTPTTPGSRLHTNFQLGNDGEYFALFNADSPRVAMTEFPNEYPEQRDDYSYGIDTTGAWRYFQIPTPGQPNGVSSISGVVPKPDVSHKRGWHEAPFTLVISDTLAGATIRYTTDGSVPTETTGFVYNGPLQVTSNLVLRAAAYRPNNLPSKIITHTYLFADHVLRQPHNPAGFPSTWGTHNTGFPNNIVPADYGMDPEIVDSPLYSAQMKDALKAIPIVSLNMKVDDWFHPTTGIYSRPLSRGTAWERPCSFEFIPVDGKDDIQVNAGIQIQGNAAREPQKTGKHPMRVTFKGDYGPKSIDYKMFPDSPVTKFDTLVLRADFGYSWLHWNPTQRTRAQRIRDAWVKDSMREMGGLASHNRYVHLFINGLYWGLYDPTERPDGSFGEAYLGGDKEDYDVMNEGAVVDGSRVAYDAMINMPNIDTIPLYDTMKVYLDMPQFIDYMLLHFFIGHEDWYFNKNWYAIRPKDGSRGYLYIPWDGENVLIDPNANRVTIADPPSGLHTKLVGNAQYRLDFADHVQRHFFNGGALMPAENIARWQNRARQIELPIIAESARWGDYRRDVHQYQNPPYELYTRDAQYRTEQNRMLNTYFPPRTTTVLNQLRNVGLYPTIAAPAFQQHGGKIDPGFQLRITATAGTIHYTTNGIDPRVYGTGTVSPAAKIYSGPITLDGTVQVKARLLNGTTWSALTEATFTTASPRIPLRVTELMYNPDPPGEAYEFIELQNFSSVPFDASGYYIEGVNYIFPPQSILTPGQIIVLGSADNPIRFAERYPGVAVYGSFTGQLVNRGERVALVTSEGRTVHSVDYSDENGWPKAADGGGYSLEIKNAFGDPDDPANWHASAALLGTPGQSNSIPASPEVVINEVYASGAPDWVEILNTGSTTVHLAGWTLEDGNTTNIFVFPATNITAGGFIVVNCDPLGTSPDSARFGLNRQDERVILRNPSGAIVDIVTTGPQLADHSIGRIDGTIQLTLLTPGAENIPAELGVPSSLVINEWLANAAPGQSDWFELHNTDPELPVALRGLFLTLSNQVFEITSAAFIAPGGHVQLMADESPRPNSVDFKLPAAGATLNLLDAAGYPLTGITYAAQTENISEGRFPDATDNIIAFPITPTPGAPNLLNFPITASSDAGDLLITWPSAATRVYRVERSENLTSWSQETEITATGATSTARITPDASYRYFRVVALP